MLLEDPLVFVLWREKQSQWNERDFGVFEEQEERQMEKWLGDAFNKTLNSIERIARSNAE
jgi:hypothetical protein